MAETSSESRLEEAKPWYGPAALKRLRVRDALLRIAVEGQYVSLAKAAEMLGVSEYLVQRAVREHGIVLPVRPNAISATKSRHRSSDGPAALKRERVRDGLLRLHREGRLTSRVKAAELLGVSDQLIRRILSEEGLELNTPPVRRGPARIRLLGLVKEGKVNSLTEAALQLGVTRQRVQQMLAAEGINIPRREFASQCRQCGRRLRSPEGSNAFDGLCGRCRRSIRRLQPAGSTGASQAASAGRR
jgi:predicted HTH domain antitoxin